MKKTTPKPLSNRLTQYGALTAAIAGITGANGQVGYTDVNPDQVLSSSGSNFSFELDMDNDGTFEFRIIQLSNFGSIAGFPAGASILGESNINNLFEYPFALSSGQVISNLQTNWFGPGSYQILNYNSCYASAPSSVPTYSNWCGVTDKYLGLRFKIGTNTHYGWARMDVSLAAMNGITIKDYYYNPTPDEAVMAGQFVLGIEENSTSKFKIVALNKSIALYNLNAATSYKLYALTGQAVLEGKTNQNTHVIEANTIASGIYIIEVMDNTTKAVLKKKIVL